MKSFRLFCAVFFFFISFNIISAQESAPDFFTETLITQIDWEEFQKDLLTISPDTKRVIYVLQQYEKYYIVENNKKSQPFDYVSAIIFSNDSKHYCGVVMKDNKYAIIYDGKIGKYYDVIQYGPIFSADSKNFIYRVGNKDKQFIVYNTKEEKKYENVSDPIFSPDGKSYAYTAFANNSQCLVLNGKESKKYELISGDVVFSGNGKNVGHIIYKDISKTPIINGKEQKTFYDIFENTLKFDYSGDNFIFVAKDSTLHTIFVKNNVAEGRYGSIDTTIISKDGKNYYYSAEYVYNDYKKNYAKVTERYVVHNGTQIGIFDEVMKNSLITDSTGEHYVFAAKMNGKWHIYHDGKSIGNHEKVSLPYLSYDGKTVVYGVYKSDGKMSMVINSKESEIYDQVFYPIFNPKDNSVVFAAKQNDKFFLVKEGIKQKEYDNLLFYFFSFTGKDLVIGGVVENKRVYSINEKDSNFYDDIKFAQYSRDDKNLYIMVNEGSGFKTILNDKESKLYNWIGGYELFDYKTDELNFIALLNDSLFKVSAKLSK